MSKANERQEGGDHYKKGGEEHWDRMVRILGLDQARGYFIASSTKYIERYQWKNGIEDLKKARHFIEKLIELEEAELQKHKKEEPEPYLQLHLSVSFDSYGCQRVYDPYFDRDVDGNRLATEPLHRHPSHMWGDDYRQCTKCGSHYTWLSAFVQCSGYDDKLINPDNKNSTKVDYNPEDTTKSTTHIFLSGELNKVDSSRNKLKVNLPGDNDLVQNGHGWAEPPDPI